MKRKQVKMKATLDCGLCPINFRYFLFYTVPIAVGFMG